MPARPGRNCECLHKGVRQNFFRVDFIPCHVKRNRVDPVAMAVVNVPLYMLDPAFFSTNSNNIRFRLLKKPTEINCHESPFLPEGWSIFIPIVANKMQIRKFTVVTVENQTIRWLANRISVKCATKAIVGFGLLLTYSEGNGFANHSSARAILVKSWFSEFFTQKRNFRGKETIFRLKSELIPKLLSQMFFCLPFY